MRKVNIILAFFLFILAVTSFSFPVDISELNIPDILNSDFFTLDSLKERELVAYAGYVFEASKSDVLKNYIGKDITASLQNGGELQDILNTLEPIGFLLMFQEDMREGDRIYISYKSIVYDVSHIPEWRDRFSAGKFISGQDYTYESKNSAVNPQDKLDSAFAAGFLGFNFPDMENSEKFLVSVNSMIYDLSAFRLWSGGRHMNRHEYAQELTYDLKKLSPHGVRKLSTSVPTGILCLSESEALKMISENKNYYSKNGRIYDKRLEEPVAVITE